MIGSCHELKNRCKSKAYTVDCFMDLRQASNAGYVSMVHVRRNYEVQV